jgi:hypothetical protein
MFMDAAGPWKFFRPWAMAGWTLYGWKIPSGETYEQLEPAAWREALLDAVDFMFWMRRGDRISLINMVCEINFHTRFRDMRLFTPFAKPNLLVRRGIKRKLAITIQPFVRPIRAPGVPCVDDCRKSEYFGEREDRSPF